MIVQLKTAHAFLLRLGQLIRDGRVGGFLGGDGAGMIYFATQFVERVNYLRGLRVRYHFRHGLFQFEVSLLGALLALVVLARR